MIGTLLKISWTNLRRDRVAQALTFLLPIVFFSIFANVFGGQANGTTARVRIAVVDEDRSDASRRIVQGLEKEKSLRPQTTADEKGTGPALDRASAERLVRDGDLPVAVVIPAGFGAAVETSGFMAEGTSIQLLADVSDPIAPQMVQGLLQKVAMTAAPDLMMEGGLRQFARYAGALTPEQQRAVDDWLPKLKPAQSGGADSQPQGMGVDVQVVDVMRTDDPHGSLISFYAAGIGVMFLLFSAVGGAGGALLDEAEAGTLERLLSTNIGMTGLLVGKWVFLALVGCAQLTVMFLWGALAFGLPLFSHLPGFAIMTVATAAAAAGSGPGPRHARPQPRAALRILDDPHPDHVGARRQHVPALPDERHDAADRPGHVQRLGARRLSEGVLAQRPAVAALAAAGRPHHPDARVPRPLPPSRQAVGVGMKPRESAVRNRHSALRRWHPP